MNSLYSRSTLFKDISIITAVYKRRFELPEVLECHGYRVYQEINVPAVDCFLYTPLSFPQDKEAGKEFDFSRYRNERCTLGVCIGGLIIQYNNRDAVVEALEEIKSHENDRRAADQVATTILTAIQQFVKDFPQLSRENITLEINISGYCLGGLFAQAVTIKSQELRTGAKIQVTCRTFESCGLPECYHNEAEQYTVNNRDYWKNGIANYKWFPNPFNTVFSDLGRTFHLMNPNDVISNKTWKRVCVAGSIKRLSFYQLAIRASETFLFSCAVRTIQNAKAYRDVVGVISSEFNLRDTELYRTHNIELGLTCFDEKSNLFQQYCQEMENWSTWRDLELKKVKRVKKGIIKLIPFSTQNCGVHTYTAFGGKRGFIERKLSGFPGYQKKKI